MLDRLCQNSLDSLSLITKADSPVKASCPYHRPITLLPAPTELSWSLTDLMEHLGSQWGGGMVSLLGDPPPPPPPHLMMTPHRWPQLCVCT